MSGTVGDHGMAIMSQRENLEFEGTIESDTAALHTLVAAMLTASPEIHCLRDPTRGGVATTLNEIASSSRVGMVIDERQIPVRETVKGACEILGLDPLYVANEVNCWRSSLRTRQRLSSGRCANILLGVTLKSSEKSSVITPGWC